MKKIMPTSLKPERAELAAQQELLLASLMDRGEPPSEIQREQIIATANSLFRKRARYISRCLPKLADDANYLDKMKEYVVHFPGSHPGGVCRDANQFHRFCRSVQNEAKQQPTFDHVVVFLRNFLSPVFLFNHVPEQKSVEDHKTSCHCRQCNR
jgi:uncharacterized short protein YbdD (DUF466 family)